MATTPRPQVSPLIRELLAIGVIRISADNTTLLLPNGSAFTLSGAQVTSNDITDATGTGKSVLTAASPLAARTAIGLAAQAAVADATDAASVITQLNLTLARLRNLGLISP